MTGMLTTETLERQMRRIATAVSVVAVVLMGLGFAHTLLFTDVLSIPGMAALPPQQVLHLGNVAWGLWAMSAGILLLTLLPMLRVLLALLLFLHARDLLDAVIGFIVLLELIVSMRAGG